MRSSILCSQCSISLPSSPPRRSACLSGHRSLLPPQLSAFSPPSRFSCATRSQNPRISVSPPAQSIATQVIVETNDTESGYVEIGYISRVHGLQGEICVKSTTDFPELRFCKPGRRWLKQRVSGRDMVQEIELLDARGHPGQKSWILKFEGIDSVDQAKQLIGSTLLVSDNDRPELDDGEFYTRDLVGMRVINKETADVIGTVVNVYNSGANDLLHVELDGCAKSEEQEVGGSGRLIWVPFVEAIVPDVDVDRRVMFITPPKGLLELNLRSDTLSKKERRQLEWKERKKFQKHLIATKKMLCELEQEHVFHGFRYGEKSQGRLLADQIVCVNTKLLQQALQNIQLSCEIETISKFLGGIKYKIPAATKEKNCADVSFQDKGKCLISEGKVAFLLALHEIEGVDISNSEHFAEILDQVVDQRSVPIVLISPSHQIMHLEKLFSENDYFGFEEKKVWFFKEEMLPVVSFSTEEPKRHKILMKSPWEILQSPVGTGGIITSLSSNRIPDILTDLGVEYIRVCSIDLIQQATPELLLGLTNSKEADIGIRISEETDRPGSFDMIFSTAFLHKLTKNVDKLQFYAVPRANSYVELIEKQWVDVVPSSPNSYEIRVSLNSCLNLCSSDKVCLLETN